MIKQEKWQRLRKKMQALDIAESDLVEKFIIGSGRGGQKLQKTASCVYLKHLPTGIETKCQKDRMRENNRYYARLQLYKKIESLVLQEKSEQQQQIEKIRRQKRRRSRRAKHKMLAEKHHRAKVKKSRKKPDEKE